MSKDPKRTVRRAERSAARAAARAAATRAATRPAAESLEGRLLLATQTFGTSLSANINEEIFLPPPTPAHNYPLAATVEGVTGTITEVRLTLHYFYHERPSDVDVLLVSPNFNSVIVMSDAGSVFPVPAETGADITLTDAATRDLPQDGPITAGLYRPTNYTEEEFDFFPDEPPDNAPTHETIMGLVNSGPVNGMWRVYIVDDTFGAEGGVFSGFGLTFVTGTPGPAAPGTPDLPPQFDRGLSSSDNVTNNNAPSFRGTATAGTQVRIFVDGVARATGPITNGTYNIQTVVPEGTHTISARALDAEGNEGPASGEITVTIDTEIPPIPTVPDLTPASDTGASNTDNVTTDTTPTFTGTALEAARIVLFAGDVLVGTADVIGGAYTITATTPLAPGTYAFSSMSTDLAGNSSAVSNPALSVTIQAGDTPVTVSQVYVRGTGWNASFGQWLEANGQGDDVLGYRVDNLPAETTVPWTNVNQIVIRYADPITGGVPQPSTYTVDSTLGGYTVTAVTPVGTDNTTFALTLDRALGVLQAPAVGTDGDRVQLSVAGGGVGSDAYDLLINSLQGDANRLNGRVTSIDVAFVRARANRTATEAPPTGVQPYNGFADLTADGRINATDISAVRARLNDQLPPPPAAAGGVFSSTAITDEVLSA